MKKDFKNETHEKIQTIWFILLDVKESLAFTKTLYDTKTPEEIEFLNSSRQLHFIRHTFWKITVLELSKLFIKGKSNHFNLINFIDDLKSNEETGLKISDFNINQWKQELINNNATIESLKILRDKFYAHTDSDREDYSSVEIKLNEIEKLIELTEKLIKEIYAIVLKADAIIENIIFEKGNFPLIRILTEAEIKRKEEIRKNFFRDRQTHLDKLRNTNS